MSFVTELKRRNVIRAALAYLTVAWLVIQISETILPLFGFDSSAARMENLKLHVTDQRRAASPNENGSNDSIAPFSIHRRSGSRSSRRH